MCHRLAMLVVVMVPCGMHCRMQAPSSRDTASDGATLARTRSAELKCMAKTAPELTRALRQCDLLGPVEVYTYLHQLRKEGRTDLLLFIAKADRHYASSAASVLAPLLDTKGIIVTCNSLTPNSSVWLVFFGQLHCRERKQVVSYFRQLVKHGNAQSRAHCYEICQENSWSELEEAAFLDRSSTVPLILPNRITVETVGQKAREYLRSLRVKRQHAP